MVEVKSTFRRFSLSPSSGSVIDLDDESIACLQNVGFSLRHDARNCQRKFNTFISLEINADESKYMLLSRHQTTGQNHNLKVANRSSENLTMF
jgi:hypothetical protein